MRTRITTAAIATGLLLATLTACGSSDDDAKPEASPSTLSQADRDAALKAAGLPPRPDDAAAAAYVKALDAIDTDIAHGKTDKAVSRGMDTCGLIKRFPSDETKQADQTNKRWSSPTHPEGHGLATAKKILTVTHKQLCPDF
ncbi:hypothetical protein [Streptomyces sp. NBC_00385]|uniref:hypothetical protein n=1 Tax=Streptomyces sp. NBC_00385 TaxID=2975733 RepID=UPI002DDC4911|nr:hypothetical protein [Streptomyces sp. NBC_00385]WRZ05072.1 hypothetical protein OG959_17795 [Streptomyces sp. NBC_00385]